MSDSNKHLPHPIEKECENIQSCRMISASCFRNDVFSSSRLERLMFVSGGLASSMITKLKKEAMRFRSSVILECSILDIRTCRCRNERILQEGSTTIFYPKIDESVHSKPSGVTGSCSLVGLASKLQMEFLSHGFWNALDGKGSGCDMFSETED